MRSVPAAFRWFGAALLGLAGCTSSQPNLKPPPHPEEFRLPPSDDARFSSYINYPKEYLNTDAINKNKDNAGDAATNNMGHFGAGGGGVPH